MDHRVAFTVSLDDMTDTTRLSTRKFALTGSAVFAILGLALAATGRPWGFLVAGLAILVILFWRFPVIDRWLLQRRASSRIGTDCEVWLDDTGVAYRQTGMNGHFDWRTVTRILDNERSLILFQDGIPLIAIPKRAFDSSEAAAAFVAAVRRASDIPGR
jgi:hypothetical protein